MHKSLLFFATFFITLSAFAQNSRYDSALAKKLGADDYGMKQYVVAFLRSGPTKPDSAQREKIIAAHLKNIGRMAKEGKLMIAGPFLDNTDLRGIYIFNVKTIEEAKALTETDPAVQSGVFVMELHPWYGSAALMQIVNIHNTIQKQSITD